jgi:hypothetical protein
VREKKKNNTHISFIHSFIFIFFSFSVSMTLRPKLCQNCHIAQVVAKIELGSGAETDVLWVCRSCTLELQKHDASMQSAPAAGAGGAGGAGGALAPGEAPQQGEFKTDDLEKLFQARMGRPINQKVNDLPEHYKALVSAEGVDNEGNKWNCIDIEFTVCASAAIGVECSFENEFFFFFFFLANPPPSLSNM